MIKGGPKLACLKLHQVNCAFFQTGVERSKHFAVEKQDFYPGHRSDIATEQSLLLIRQTLHEWYVQVLKHQ